MKKSDKSMLMDYNIYKGDTDIQSQLQVLLHERGNEEKGLEIFLKDLEITLKLNGAWWVALDQQEDLKAALSVHEENKKSFLRAIWTRISDQEALRSTSNALLSKWMKNSSGMVKEFHADLSVNSPLVPSLIYHGFQEEKSLITIYEMETNWYSEEVSDIILREVDSGELGKIYDTLVLPDINTDSPLFASRDGFLHMAQHVSDEGKESWVLAEDIKGNIIGFAASFKAKHKHPLAVLYGPHALKEDVLRVLIAEMLTYWKMKGFGIVRIMRVAPFSKQIIQYFRMIVRQQSVRYSKVI